jgi:hypothetical protein
MSDSLILYRTIVELVQSSQVQFHDIRCLITFIWVIVAVIMEKNVHLSKWSIHRAGGNKATSKQRQFARWLNNTKIEPTGIYKRLAQVTYSGWEDHQFYLALDNSSLWDRFVIVRVALIYPGRALPLSWVILK